jgi:DNA-binding GntR family transcriptional regulator
MPISSGPGAAERAYAFTKNQILRGELAGGELLSEGRISAALAISRTPVHEAFLRLDAERLLTLSSRKGAVITAMPAGEASDILQMREAIEGSAAERVAATARDPRHLAAALAPILERQRAALDSTDIDTFVEADDDFHSAVVELSGNRIAAHFHDLLRDRQQRLRHQVFAVSNAQLQPAFEEHGQLSARLLAHDAAGYREVLHCHIGRHQGAL